MLDSQLLLRDGTVALTTTTNGASVDFGGGDVKAFTYVLVVPQATGTTPTLDVKIQESDDNSTWVDVLVFAQITTAAVKRVSGFLSGRYRRAVFTVAGTTPDFGLVLMGPELGGDYSDF